MTRKIILISSIALVIGIGVIAHTTDGTDAHNHTCMYDRSQMSGCCHNMTNRQMEHNHSYWNQMMESGAMMCPVYGSAADSTYSTIHKGKAVYFSNSAAMKEFKKSPCKYSHNFCW